MSISSISKSIGRAAIVAAALGAVSLTALPAFAAPPSSLQLTMKAKPQAGQAFRQHSGQQKSFGFGDDDDDGGLSFCLSDWDVKDELRDVGFDHVKIVAHYSHHRVKVKAYYDEDDTWYSMRVDECSGEVDHIHELY